MTKTASIFKIKLLGWLAALGLLMFAPLALSAGFTVSTTTAPLTGLWWNQNESGWGMSLTQQGPVVFMAWYTYDQAGKPSWYVMSSCSISGNACNGDIYNVVGGTPPTAAWNGAAKVVTKVGSATLSFSDNDSGTFSYSIGGVSGTKAISRQNFASGSAAPAVDYSGLWWNANESGWGVALAQQYGVIFATMYVYDGAGNPVWYVASNCAVSGTGCNGELYQVTGGSAPTTTWNGANKVVTKVGSIGFVFTDAASGTMTYSINGVSVSKAITRQQFYTAPSGSLYAGNWSGSYSGSDSGTCSMVISTGGALSGSCVGKLAGSFTISGSVDAQGEVSFHIGSGSSISGTFSGQFVSTTRVNGYWSVPGYGLSGAWAFTRN